MLKIVSLFLLLNLNIIYASSINIAVAANVSYAIDDLKKEFKKLYPNTKVNVTLGSSGKLTAQIKHGAPYHIFMSANMKYPNALYKDGLAITKPIVYAQGSLAMISTSKVNLSKGIDLLKEKSIKRIAVANPKTAPYGIATKQAIKNSGIYENIKDKFIYGESISQTVSYAIKATDVGFIAKSSLFSPKMKRFKKGKNWIEIDSKLYTPINQGIVILKEANSNKEVENFYNFILSENGKKIFKNFGYLIP
jgi:molybdate transport system substrate-binding protein